MEVENIDHLEAFIEKASDGSFTAVASTNAMDRHGEVVDNNGWDLKAYKKNPVILWGHDHSQLPIGVSTKTWVEGEGKSAKLMIKPQIHDITPMAQAVKELISQGILKTLSVGFRPLDSPDGVTFTKNELLEVSVVNVPANADAMMLAYKGLKDKGFEDDVISDLGIKAMDETQMRQSYQGMQAATDTMQNHLDNMGSAMGAKAVIDEVKEDVDDENNLVVNAPKAVNPPETPRQRLSMLKVIARASDKLLEADRKQEAVDQTELVKIIKKATEIMTVAEKEKL